jgi:hypothetical protein
MANIGSGTGAITTPQPQIAQLELTFAGPLVKDSYVESSADLTSFNVTTNYEQKLVWSKADRAFWYISSGDGSLLSHWKMLVSTLTIEAYDPSQSSGYVEGTVVYQNGRIYKAIQDAPFGIAPTNGAYWLSIAGDNITYRLVYVDMSTWAVVTDIKNPTFEVIFGDVQQNIDSSYVIGDDGMIEVLNQEIVDAYPVKQDGETGTWNIYFETNGVPFLASGVVNIK